MAYNLESTNSGNPNPENTKAHNLIEEVSPFAPCNGFEHLLRQTVTTIMEEEHMDFVVYPDRIECIHGEEVIAQTLHGKTASQAIPSLLSRISGIKKEKAYRYKLLCDIYSTMLEPLQRKYPLGLRLNIQKNDMLPVIAEQMWWVQHTLYDHFVSPVVDEETYNRVQDEIRAKRQTYRANALEPNNPVSEIRKLDDIKELGSLDAKTLDTLTRLKCIGQWLGDTYLTNISICAVDSLADDPYKQARIQNSTYFKTLDHVFQDGISGSTGVFNITADILIYHCYVNHIQLKTLDDALLMIKSDGFKRMIHSLLGAVNAENVTLWDMGYIPADLLDNEDIPQLTPSAREYFNAHLRTHNDEVSKYEDMPWDHSDIRMQHQRHCPAAIHSAHLTIKTSPLPQPGESTVAYINHLRKLEQEIPGIFTLTQAGDSYTLKMLKDPAGFLNELFCYAIDFYIFKQKQDRA